MNPEESPETAPIGSGVRRINNVPLYIIGAIVASFMIVMVLVAADRSQKSSAAKPKEEVKAASNTTAAFAKEITEGKKAGIVEPAKPPTIPVKKTQQQAQQTEEQTEPAGAEDLQIKEATEHLRRRQEELKNQPAPVPVDNEAEMIRTSKLQMFENAVKSGTAVQAQPQSNSAGAGTATPRTREEMIDRIASLRRQSTEAGGDITAQYQQRLTQIKGMGLGGTEGIGGGGGIALASAATAQPSGGNGYGQFDNRGGGDRWRLDSKPEPPRSRYELRAGAVIPAILIRGINSELPGQITAQVSQNVYDTATGKYLLIPQGTMAVGAYSSEVIYGQARVLVAWQRLTFPDGKAMDIGAMPGADEAGYSGFGDLVNNHYLRIFGSALLMSGIVAGVSLSQDHQGVATTDTQRASDAMSEALGQQLGQVAAQMISKNLNIAPTLEIRPGYRLNIAVTKDLTMPAPYAAFDY